MNDLNFNASNLRKKLLGQQQKAVGTEQKYHMVNLALVRALNDYHFI